MNELLLSSWQKDEPICLQTETRDWMEQQPEQRTTSSCQFVLGWALARAQRWVFEAVQLSSIGAAAMKGNWSKTLGNGSPPGTATSAAQVSQQGAWILNAALVALLLVQAMTAPFQTPVRSTNYRTRTKLNRQREERSQKQQKIQPKTPRKTLKLGIDQIQPSTNSSPKNHCLGLSQSLGKSDHVQELEKYPQNRKLLRPWCTSGNCSNHSVILFITW